MFVELSERIALWRKAKGLTQAELAAAVGVTPAAVYQWEGSGDSRTTPSVGHLEKLVGALGLTIGQFYGRVPKTKVA